MELLVISGISGSGKSTVLRTVEDRGWMAIDNLPPTLMPQLVASPPAERVAVVIDARQSDIDALPDVLDSLDAPYRLLVLEASEATVRTRYQETRRRHPAAETVGDGFERERALLAPLRERSDWVIATDNMPAGELRSRVEQLLKMEAGMVVRIVSFGWKWGSFDGDLLFDARHLPNPHWDPNLRALPGSDPAALEYIRRDGAFDRWVDELAGTLDWLIPRYEAAGKSYLEIGVGCTGGRHRSVATATALAERLAAHGPVLVHRDRDRAGNQGGE